MKKITLKELGESPLSYLWKLSEYKNWNFGLWHYGSFSVQITSKN